MAIEKLKFNFQDSKIERGPIHILKTMKQAMNSDWSDHRQDTKIQNKF